MKIIARTPDQIPGLIDMYAVPTTQIKTIENFNISLVDNPVVYHARWAIDTINHTVNSSQDPAGPFYSAIIKGFIYGINHTSTALLDEMLSYKFTVVYRDNNGCYMRIGNADIGLALKYKESSEGRIGYEVEFYASVVEGAKPVHSLSGIFPSFNITINSSPLGFPRHYFTGQGVYPIGTEVVISALSPVPHPEHPNITMRFVEWTIERSSGFAVFSGQNPHSFILTENRNINLVAVYNPV